MKGRELPLGWSGCILLATLLYLVVGLAVLAVWQFTGSIYWVVQFFGLPSAVLLICFSGIQLWFSTRVCAEFSPGEPMRLAWKLISASALFDLAGTISVQLFGSDKAWNALAHASWWPRPLGQAIFDIGHVLQGTFRFALLAAGLWCVLKLYRVSGFLGRFRITDWLLLATFAGYCIREALDLMRYYQASNPPGWSVILGWPVDPLLWLLFAEAILLHRSVQRMGTGLIGRCWRTFSAGIFLILLGDAAIWATSYGFLPWPWSSLGWYVWMPAAASFALAPVYQLEAIRWASSGRTAPID